METQLQVQQNKHFSPAVADKGSKKAVCVRSKEICNARLLLISCGVEWEALDVDSLGPLPSKRTKSGFVGTFECGNRWQAQYLHRTLGAYDTAYEAGCAVARAVVRLAVLHMLQDSTEVVFEGCLSTLAAKGTELRTGAPDTPPSATGKNAAVVCNPSPASGSSDSAPFSFPHPEFYAPVPVRPVHSGYPSGTISSPMPARSSMPQAMPSLCSASTQATASMREASPRPNMLLAPSPGMKYKPQDEPIAPGHFSVGRPPSFSAPSNGPLPTLPFMQESFNSMNPMGQPVFFQQLVYYVPPQGFVQSFPYGYASSFAPPPSYWAQAQAAPPFFQPPADIPYANVAWNNYAPNVDARQQSAGPSGDEQYWCVHNCVPQPQMNQAQSGIRKV